MPRGADSRTPSPVALLPMAAVAAAVLVLALVSSGGKTGTIVVERIAVQATTANHGQTGRHTPAVITTVTETTAAGRLERILYSNTLNQPSFQELMAGNTMQLYDEHTNTIYMTTLHQYRRATVAELRRSTPKGAMVGVGVGHVQQQSASPGSAASPGRTSIYAQGLRTHVYRIAARTRIGGRPVLRLIQRPIRIPIQGSGVYTLLTTVYVSPLTYAPIESVTRSILPGFVSTIVTHWLTYRVLPATPANRWFVSLTARHPHASVRHDPSAYLRAIQAETRTMRTH